MRDDQREVGRFPFNTLPFLRDDDFALDFPRPITFFVGENGSGKSTLLEAIAALCGFHAGGGSQDHHLYPTPDGDNALAPALRPSWLPRVTRGFFFRSESFFDLAGYIDRAGTPEVHYGGHKLHGQSHGESFLALFTHRLETDTRNVYLMDEPETALSPSRQLAFLRLLRQWERSGNVQAIIATHSPIILSYPGATLYDFDGERIAETTVEETEHYRVTRAFLANPERYLAEVFAGSEDGE